MRRRWSEKALARVFLAHDGKCHLCGGRIDGGREAWQADHVLPLALGGEDEEANLAPAHVACHRQKTGQQDVPAIRKAQRQGRRTLGIRKTTRNPLPGSRGSGWKQKLGGQWVRRDEEV